jgi:hypothetical protein
LVSGIYEIFLEFEVFWGFWTLMWFFWNLRFFGVFELWCDFWIFLWFYTFECFRKFIMVFGISMWFFKLNNYSIYGFRIFSVFEV